MKTKIVIRNYKHNLTKYNIQECKMRLTGLHDSFVHGLVSSSFVILCSIEDIFEWKPLLGASIKILLSNGFCSVRLGQIWTHTTGDIFLPRK